MRSTYLIEVLQTPFCQDKARASVTDRLEQLLFHTWILDSRKKKRSLPTHLRYSETGKLTPGRTLPVRQEKFHLSHSHFSDEGQSGILSGIRRHDRVSQGGQVHHIDQEEGRHVGRGVCGILQQQTRTDGNRCNHTTPADHIQLGADRLGLPR